MKQDDSGVMLLHSFSLAASKRTQPIEVKEVIIAAITSSPGKSNSDETIDFGSGADDVEFLLSPIRHENRRPIYRHLAKTYASTAHAGAELRWEEGRSLRGFFREIRGWVKILRPSLRGRSKESRCPPPWGADHVATAFEQKPQHLDTRDFSTSNCSERRPETRLLKPCSAPFQRPRPSNSR